MSANNWPAADNWYGRKDLDTRAKYISDSHKKDNTTLKQDKLLQLLMISNCDVKMAGRLDAGINMEIIIYSIK